MRVVFMGTPEFAVPSLEQLVLNGYEVAAVYTQTDRPAGRGWAPVASPVKMAALALGRHVEQPDRLKQAESVKRLSSFQPDVVVVAAFGQILPAAVLAVPARGTLNIHPSLLPKFRGASPVASAILSGAGFTGVSVMLLDEGLDTGPVLARAPVSISPRDNTGTLTAKLAWVGANLLLDVLPQWLSGGIKPWPQDDALATYTKKFEKEDGEIGWSLPARELWLRVRALSPWPGGYTRWQGKQLRITEAVPVASVGNVDAGRVVALEGESAFGVGTGAGVLGVVKVQLEGKREMSAADFLRGQRDFIGAVLPS